MNLKEDDIINMVKQILSDNELDYYQNKKFVIKLDELDELDEFDKKIGFKKPWICSVHTRDWQFDSEDGIYSFTIDDLDPTLIFFIDGSGGQIPNSFIKKDENGKYYREYILR